MYSFDEPYQAFSAVIQQFFCAAGYLITGGRAFEIPGAQPWMSISRIRLHNGGVCGSCTCRSTVVEEVDTATEQPELEALCL